MPEKYIKLITNYISNIPTAWSEKDEKILDIYQNYTR
jgi:hypothetical protein